MLRNLLHLENNKEAFATFRMRAQLNRICISVKVYFGSSLVEYREAEVLVTRLLATIKIRNGGDPGPR